MWSTPSLPGPLEPGVLVNVSVPSIGQIDQLKHYSNLLRLCAKKKSLRNNYTKNVSIYNKRDCLISRHRITLDEFTCC